MDVQIKYLMYLDFGCKCSITFYNLLQLYKAKYGNNSLSIDWLLDKTDL